jgi:hypothetical protein
MKFEGYTAKTEKEEAIDGELFSKIEALKVSAIAGTKIETKVLDEQKELFLNGQVECPHFTYDKIEEKDYGTLEDKLLALKEELKSDENTQEVLKQTYLWKLNERIAKLRMLRELQRTMLGGDSVYHMRRFTKYSEFIYGAPEEEIYQGVAEKLYEKLEWEKDGLPEEKKDAYARLRAFARIPEEVIGEKPEKTEEPEITDPEEVKQYFEEALIEMGLEKEWTIEIDEERRSMAVSLAKKKVFIPPESQLKLKTEDKKITLKRIRGLIVHELGTHALRNHNGSRSRLQLLSIGLDRYEVGEEGLATYREQQESEDEADYAGFDNYFAASLAKGLDGGGERNFAQVFGILRDYYEVCGKVDDQEAQELAWNRCVRIFRGTTGDVPGAFFTKDIIYRKGNIATYSLMNKEGSEKIDFNVGKFDPANPRHLGILIELGILDSDLERLLKEGVQERG